MVVFFVFFALLACRESYAQAYASILVDVSPEAENQEIEKRYTPELLQKLQSAKADALLLYTEYTAKASTDMKNFIRNISQLTQDTLKGMNRTLLDIAPSSCRTEFEKHLKKIEYDAHRAASFSAENHHKFFLGHMIVFRMHLNKSEEYIQKCDEVIKTCGSECETTPRIIHWRRLALNEINRVRGDIKHSRDSYKDLLLHVHRKLNHFRRRAASRSKEAIARLEACIRHS